MPINDELADAVLRNAHRTVAYEKTVNLAIRGNLEELSRELGRILGDAELADALPRFQVQRLQRTKREVDKAIDTTYAANTRELAAGNNVIATQTQRLVVQSFNRVFKAEIFNNVLVPAELKALSRNPVVLGGTTTENWWKQKTKLKQAFVEQMRLGLAQGETNEQLIQRVRGKSTGAKETVVRDGKRVKVPQRTGGIMDTSRREAEALVRTSAQTVSNSTLLQTYQANEDVMGGMALLVTLDGRTTLICMSLSGGQYTLDGDPLPNSVSQDPFPGPPPYHWNCRTIITPITKSWEELSGRKKSAIRNEATDLASVRASMNGEAPGRQGYSGFLRGQPRSFQNEVLGKKRAELFRSGKLELHQLTDSSLRPLTLAELEKVIG